MAGGGGRQVATLESAEKSAQPLQYLPTPRAAAEPMGQTPGTTVHVRVAACDSRLPGGMTPYTAWVALIASL